MNLNIIILLCLSEMKTCNELLNSPYGFNSLLHLAAQNSHKQLIQPLLRAGVDPTLKLVDLLVVFPLGVLVVFWPSRYNFRNNELKFGTFSLFLNC